MKLNKLNLIYDAISVIARETETTKQEIIDSLIGIAWDDEEAFELTEFCSYDN